MSIYQRIIGIFGAPRKTFEYLNEKPDWLTPLIIVVFVGLVTTAIVLPTVVLPEQAAKLSENPNIPPDKLPEIQEKMMGPFPIIAGLVGVLLSTPIMLLLLSLIFWGVFSLFGGETVFKKIFSAWCYSSLIGAVASVVKLPLILLKKTAGVHTSLALLLSADTEGSFLYHLLAKFDFFILWQLVILTIAFSVIYKFSHKKSGAVVFGLWTIGVVISLALGRLLPQVRVG